MSGPVNPIFYAVCVKAGPFTASDACTGCGQCVRRCPTNNIVLREGKPVWGKDCTPLAWLAFSCYCLVQRPSNAAEEEPRRARRLCALKLCQAARTRKTRHWTALHQCLCPSRLAARHRLARALLATLVENYEELRLCDLPLLPLNTERLGPPAHALLTRARAYDDDFFRYARQFAAADRSCWPRPCGTCAFRRS